MVTPGINDSRCIVFPLGHVAGFAVAGGGHLIDFTVHCEARAHFGHLEFVQTPYLSPEFVSEPSAPWSHSDG